MKTALCTLPIIVIAFSLAAAGAMQLDYSTGEYVKDGQNALSTKVKILSREEREIESKKLAEAKAEAQAKAAEEKKLQDRVQQRLENEQRYPWMKLVMPDIGIVTNDYVNTTSNSVIITILDYARAANDGVKDRRKLIADYRLCLLLHPGDKYHEIGDGGNGVRLARYVQAHQLCQQNMEERYGDKYMRNDNDDDGLSDLAEMCGTNIALNISDDVKSIVSFTDPSLRDSDFDGLSDKDEIIGTNGFVTDPNNPDTDGDGIPDGSDKNPLEVCLSDETGQMPAEWCNFYSRGNSALYNILIIPDNDIDNDGFTNRDEFLMRTDPTKPDSGNIIYSISKQICRQNPNITIHTNDFYHGEFFFVIRGEKPVRLKIETGSANATISKVSSIKLSKSSQFLNGDIEVIDVHHDKKLNFIILDVDPYVIHSFKFSGIGKEFSEFYHGLIIITYKGKDVEYANRNFTARIPFNPKFITPNIFPKTASVKRLLQFPPEDFYFTSSFTNYFTWKKEAEQDFPFEDNLNINKLESYQPKLNALYSYNDEIKSVERMAFTSNNCKYRIDEKDFDNILHSTFTWNICSCYRNLAYFSEMRPLFKTERLALGRPFVFEPMSLDEIRELLYP